MGGVIPTGPVIPGVLNTSGIYTDSTGKGGLPTTAPLPAPVTPAGALDSTYYQNVANNQFRVGNQINALNLQHQQANTAMQQALAQLSYQQPRDALALEQRANRSGGLYSSVEAQNQGNLAHSYQVKGANVESKYGNQIADIANKIAELNASIPLYNQTQGLASEGRQQALDQANPAIGQSTSLQGAPSLGSQAAQEASSEVTNGDANAWNAAFKSAFNRLWLQSKGTGSGGSG